MKWAKTPAAVPLTEREIAQRRYSEALDVTEAFKLQLLKRQTNARTYDTPHYWDRVAEALAQVEAAEAHQLQAWTELDYHNKARAAALGALSG